MNIKEAETTIRIKNLLVLEVEIPKEPRLQKQSIFNLFQYDIPSLITDLLELNDYRRREAQRHGHPKREERSQAIWIND